MEALKLLWKTSDALVLRFLITIAVALPGYWSVMWGVRVGRSVTGLNMTLTDLLFAYIGISLFIVYIEFGRRFLSYVVRYSQLACFVEILSGSKKGGLLQGLKTASKRFPTVVGSLVVDRYVKKSVTEITKWIVDKGNFIPNFLRKGILGSIVSKTLKEVVFHVDEVVISYLFRHKEIGTWEGIYKGLILYAKSWKELIQSSFLMILYLKIFGYIFNIVFVIGSLWFLWGKGIEFIISYFITYKIVTVVLKETFLDPYKTASMVSRIDYNKDLSESKELGERIEKISEGFKDIIKKRENVGDIVEGVVPSVIGMMDESDGRLFSKAEKVIETVNKK